VITTYVAGIPELVRHGENGWLVPAGDVAALAGALEEAISESPLTLARMGEAGRTRVLERHAIDTEVAKLAEHFLAAAGSDAASRALKGATA
jgi:glycosyltransferase involved in cell wall biosynthesis